ncbi:MAG: hypothetical protein ACF8R7_12590 [Phycisphaerales bacterium JB039]
MKRPPKLDPQRKLIGFGPVGWVASAVFIILLQAVVRGVDVRAFLLATIDRFFGIDPVMWIVTHVLPWHHFAIAEGRFGLIAAMYWLVALQIYPQRKSLLWPVVLIGWALVAPMLPTEIIAFLARRSADPTAFFGPTVFSHWFMGIVLGCELISAALLVAMTRSWLVCAGAGAGIALTALLVGIKAQWPPVMPLAVGSGRLDPWLWHAVMCATALMWAIGARRRAIGPGQCEACGYDRRGLDLGALCPECGAAATGNAC